jgi:hypothetical protein
MWFPFAMTTLAVADSSLGGRSAAGSMAFLSRDVTIERDLNGQVRQAWNS